MTVIVPVYNVAPYLRQCLDTIVNQTYSYLEVIIVDDGSTDGSELICDEYAEHDPRVKVVHKANGGQSSARNVALDMMQGDWVLFVDSDDWIELDTIAYLLAHKAEDADLVEFGVNMVYPNNEEAVLNPDNVLSAEAALKMLVTQDRLMGLMCNKLFRASRLDRFRFIEGRYYEDTPFIMEFLYASECYQYVAKVFYHYRQGREGQSSIGFGAKNCDMYTNIEYLMDKYKETSIIPYLKTWYVYKAKLEYFIVYIQDSPIREQNYRLIEPYIKKARQLDFIPSGRMQFWQWRAFQLMPSLYAFLVVHVQPMFSRLLRFRG